ncbi:MAG: hypothetical protein ACJARR_003883, partial [Pseudophaeobacter arcticus]
MGRLCRCLVARKKGGLRTFAAVCMSDRSADKAGVRKINFWFRIPIIAAFPHASFDFCSNLDQLAELILKRRNPSLLSGLHLGLV